MQLDLSHGDEGSSFFLNEEDQAEVLSSLVKSLKALSRPQSLICSYDSELRISNIMTDLCTSVYSYLNRSVSDISKKKWW